ncbi:MAG: CheB methylesterase domain-containing protein, partial [Acidimicrobiales bacterium]|nr:CheB methylesterase domain-containing protein [Acidimicrobiales bacterium]
LGLEMASAGQLYVPSADTLFESVAHICGESAVGVLLTGMGSDGARGLKRLHDAGAATIAQDEESSTVFGMPRAAIELGAADQVLGITEISAALADLFGLRRS